MTIEEFMKKHDMSVMVAQKPQAAAESRFKIRQKATQLHKGKSTGHEGYAYVNDPSAEGFTVTLTLPMRQPIFLSFFTKKGTPSAESFLTEMAAYAGTLKALNADNRLALPSTVTSDLLVLSTWMGKDTYFEFQQIGEDLLGANYTTEV